MSSRFKGLEGFCGVRRWRARPAPGPLVIFERTKLVPASKPRNFDGFPDVLAFNGVTPVKMYHSAKPHENNAFKKIAVRI